MGGLKVSSLTDIGSRSTNEDRVFTDYYDGLYLLAVADGMGGHSAGEIASSVAIDEVKKAFQNGLLKRLIDGTVREVIEKANMKVYHLSKEQPQYTGMGTTLVMALIRQDGGIISNVGDSRAYCISGSRIERITRDHSAVQELLDKERITEDAARHHPYRSVLTRVLGVEPEVQADLYDVTLEPGDMLLLCSDGLTNSLNDQEILEIVNDYSDADETCTSLVSNAKEKGSTDNVSVILAKVT
jgi:serine/threonine protein phosphatase PrpC